MVNDDTVEDSNVLMSTMHNKARPGHYRLQEGVRIVSQDGSALVVCDYPLRVVQLNPVAAQLLLLCIEERTCGQLAQATGMPVNRVETFCDQLCWKGLLEAGPPLPPPTWPCVSIVIPSYNRAKELERCLYSLFSLDYPANCLEIIVVDDASTDETGSMLQHLAQEVATHEQELHVIRHEKQRGVGISRNTGAEAAQYGLVAYLDSDCVASPGWLRELVPTFQDTRIAAVGGMIRAYDRNTLLGSYEDVCSSLYMGERTQQVSLKGPLTYLPSANMLVRRMVWEKLAGFAAMTQGEDVDFCWRLLTSGASMNYVPRGVIYHDIECFPAYSCRLRLCGGSIDQTSSNRTAYTVVASRAGIFCCFHNWRSVGYHAAHLAIYLVWFPGYGNSNRLTSFTSCASHAPFWYI